MADIEQDRRIVIGRIAGLFGVRGWLKIRSHTQPMVNILGYNPWYLRLEDRWQAVAPVQGRQHGKGLIAQLEGYSDRDAAACLVGCDIAVYRSQLPVAAPDEMYWTDLIGLRVITVDGVALGAVDHLLETGANDVLVVRGERERLLPYVDQVVLAIDAEAGVIQVDWDPDF
jgi:16S rRNA processing protein RimM